MIRRWLALTYYLYALRLAALSHFYFNRLYVWRLHVSMQFRLPYIFAPMGFSRLQSVSEIQSETHRAALPRIFAI